MSVDFRWHRVSNDKSKLREILFRCARKSKTPCDGVGSQCKALNKKTKKFEEAINKEYVRKDIVPHASHVLVASDHDDIRGFLIGSAKKLHRDDGTTYGVFYIDLVCSRHRKGKDLLLRAEIFALSKGFRTITLRAASPKLLNVYRRRGYTRDTDACRARTRSQRRKLRDLDKVASALFKGDRRDWKTSGDGWWMSKCSRKHVQALKTYIRAQKNAGDRKTLRDQLNRGIRKLGRR